jgi:hypothetical protein
VFRQQHNQLWADVFHGIENELEQFLASRRPAEEAAEEKIPVSVSLSDYLAGYNVKQKQLRRTA